MVGNLHKTLKHELHLDYNYCALYIRYVICQNTPHQVQNER